MRNSGIFVNFSCIYFRAKMSSPKVDWAPTPMAAIVKKSPVFRLWKSGNPTVVALPILYEVSRGPKFRQLFLWFAVWKSRIRYRYGLSSGGVRVRVTFGSRIIGNSCLTFGLRCSITNICLWYMCHIVSAVQRTSYLFICIMYVNCHWMKFTIPTFLALYYCF